MIGLFDSGVGGLSILEEVKKVLPHEDVVYFGDTANVPYGTKTDEQIISLSMKAVEFLVQKECDVIVVACNTATSVAITALRQTFPTIPLIGVVPVVKTVVERTKVKRAVVCATSATLNSALYEKLKQDFASEVEILDLAKPEWVTMVEAGEVDSVATQSSIEATAKEIEAFGADIVAFGCTHFAFLRTQMEKVLPNVAILDSGGAIARHVLRVLCLVMSKSFLK
jgi:glutamate racemase